MYTQGKGHSPDDQWVYNNKLAVATGPDQKLSESEPWRVRLGELTFLAIFNRPATFRDQWTEEEKEAFAVAHDALVKVLFEQRIAKFPKAKL